MDDSTFRAYRNNPKFLSSILPLSSELDFILSRIFEHDPRRRISIPELRDLILRCNNFTTRSNSALPMTPQSKLHYVPGSDLICQTSANSRPIMDGYVQPGRAVAPSSAACLIMPQLSTSSGASDHGSLFSAASSCSSTSSCDSYESPHKAVETIAYTVPQQAGPLFNCSFAFSGPLTQQSCMPSIAAH